MKRLYCPIEHYKYMHHEQLSQFLNYQRTQQQPELKKQIKIQQKNEKN
jgi:hypothetical protein